DSSLPDVDWKDLANSIREFDDRSLSFVSMTNCLARRFWHQAKENKSACLELYDLMKEGFQDLGVRLIRMTINRPDDFRNFHVSGLLRRILDDGLSDADCTSIAAA